MTGASDFLAAFREYLRVVNEFDEHLDNYFNGEIVLAPEESEECSDIARSMVRFFDRWTAWRATNSRADPWTLNMADDDLPPVDPDAEAIRRAGEIVRSFLGTDRAGFQAAILGLTGDIPTYERLVVWLAEMAAGLARGVAVVTRMADLTGLTPDEAIDEATAALLADLGRDDDGEEE